MSTSNIVVNNLMRKHGDMAIAGLGVAMKVNMIVVMLLIGLGSGIAGMAAPVDWIALINTNKIPIIGPE